MIVMNTKRNFSDISLEMSQFLLKAVGSWITVNKTEERQRRINMLYTVTSHIYALYINITDIYHSWGDFNVSTKLFFKIVHVSSSQNFKLTT